MQKYSHDYTLVQEAMDSLYSATRLHANECYSEALDRINEARTILQQYLSQDNMVQDNDTADGWVKAGEAMDVIGALRSQVAHYQDTMLAMGRTSAEVVRRSEETVRENEQLKAKVVRHGQIDRQYKQQLDGVGDPSCPVYGKDVRITGTFNQIGMSRDDVAAACQRMGAKSASEGFVKSMDVFIMGNDAGPSKLKKVQDLRAEGRDVRILSLIEFKEIFDKYLPKA